MRKCKVCKIEKPLEEFPIVRKEYREHRCRECKRINHREHARQKRANNEHRKYEREQAYLHRCRNPEKTMYKTAKRRAKQYERSFTITLDDIVIPKKCPLLGIELQMNKGGAADNSPSLDRIDTTLGYVPDNVKVISRLANIMKAHATNEQLLLFARNIKKYIRESPPKIG